MERHGVERDDSNLLFIGSNGDGDRDLRAAATSGKSLFKISFNVRFGNVKRNIRNSKVKAMSS